MFYYIIKLHTYINNNNNNTLVIALMQYNRVFLGWTSVDKKTEVPKANNDSEALRLYLLIELWF